MNAQNASEQRLNKLRDIMRKRDLDAMIVQKNANLRWLTLADNTFDDELAHSAFITRDTQALRTDSRYLQTFKERLGDDTIWELDGGLGAGSQDTHATWLAERIAEAGAKCVGIENTVSVAYMDALEEALAQKGVSAQLVHLDSVLEDARIVKDADELDALQRAQDVSDEALRHVVAWIKPGVTEREAQRELDNYMVTHGASAVSFATIMATGSNGALPHAQPGDTVLKTGDLVVIDFGALVDEYHADMTRTIAIGEPSAKQREVYAIVKEAHEKAAAAVHAGVIGADIHAIAQGVIEEAGYGEYFNHGLGHGVGLEIHENPCFRPSWTREIPKNAVVTVEPGIYLPGEFGIRLEDTGVVTQDGFKPFTSLDHELIVVQ